MVHIYNRYIRNDNGAYTRIPEREANASPDNTSVPEQPPHGSKNSQQQQPQTAPKKSDADSINGILRHLLDQLHLDHVDAGDLLLLGLLFFLFREGADEELLVALGLLLIL